MLTLCMNGLVLYPYGQDSAPENIKAKLQRVSREWVRTWGAVGSLRHVVLRKLKQVLRGLHSRCAWYEERGECRGPRTRVASCFDQELDLGSGTSTLCSDPADPKKLPRSEPRSLRGGHIQVVSDVLSGQALDASLQPLPSTRPRTPASFDSLHDAVGTTAKDTVLENVVAIDRGVVHYARLSQCEHTIYSLSCFAY